MYIHIQGTPAGLAHTKGAKFMFMSCAQMVLKRDEGDFFPGYNLIIMLPFFIKYKCTRSRS